MKSPVLTLSIAAAESIERLHAVDYEGKVAAPGGSCFGIAISDAATGDMLGVDVEGSTLAIAGEALQFGQALQVGDAGRLVAHTSGTIVARALSDVSADGGVLLVLMLHSDAGQPQIGQQMVWSVQNGALPPGWFDTLEDESHGNRIIEFCGGKNPDPYLRFTIDTEVQGSFTHSPANEFWFAVQRTSPEESTGTQYGFPATIAGFDFEIDWGDGTVEQLTDADIVDGAFRHTYAAPGVYEISVIGDCPYWCARRDSAKWLELRNWGSIELLAANTLLLRTRNLQIVGEALKFPPRTPNCQRWHRAFESCRSDYHPAYDTGAAELLDRLFYQASIRRAPFLNTSSNRNFHNLFRSCQDLEGPLPWYNIQHLQTLYRAFRNAQKLRSEDLPNWAATSHVRSYNSCLADLPLVQAVPSNWRFDSAHLAVDPTYDTAGGLGAEWFAAGQLHTLGAAQVGAACAVDVNSMTITGSAPFREAFRNNTGTTVINGLTIEVGLSTGLFMNSALQSVAMTINQPADPDLVSARSLDFAFALCSELTDLDLACPQTFSLGSLISGSPVTSLRLVAPEAATSVRAILSGCNTLQAIELPGWVRACDVSDQQLSRAAILALIESLGAPEEIQPLIVGGNPGFADLTPADEALAGAKNWELLEEAVELPFAPIDDGQDTPQQFVRFFETDQELLAICGAGFQPRRLVASMDAGYTWEILRDLSSGGSFLRAGRAGDWILLQTDGGSGNRLWRSNDNGANWAGVNPHTTGFQPTDLLCDGSDTVVVVGGNFSAGTTQYRLSTNAGATFSTYTLPAEFSRLLYRRRVGWVWVRGDGSGVEISTTFSGDREFLGYPDEAQDAAALQSSVLFGTADQWLLAVGITSASATLERVYARPKTQEGSPEWSVAAEQSLGPTADLTSRQLFVFDTGAIGSEFLLRARSVFSSGPALPRAFYSFGASGPFSALTDEFLESGLFREDGVIFTYTDAMWNPASFFVAREEL